jgi:hypothetical protein
MVDSGDDWRLTGQERYLQGVSLQLARWKADRPGWDHDHCEFCWAKFGGQELPGALQVGYKTADGYRWICQNCFSDFQQRFGWRVEESSTD